MTVICQIPSFNMSLRIISALELPVLNVLSEENGKLMKMAHLSGNFKKHHMET